MTSTLRIKRRTTGSAGAPASLAAAEIAYNEIDHTLYYGEGNSSGQATAIVSIAGAGKFASPGPIGSTTPSTGAFTTLTTGPAACGTSISPALIARQIANGNDTLLFQRFTDTSPTGNLLRCVNAGSSANLALVDINGNASFASINSTPIGATTPAAGTFTNLSATGAITGSISSVRFVLSDGTTYGFCATGPALGGSAQNSVLQATFNVANSNFSVLRILEWRNTAGTSWTTGTKRIQHRVDVTDMGFIDFNPAGYACGVGIGYGPISAPVYGLYVASSGLVTMPNGAAITGGTSNNHVIGGTTAAAGTFTTLTVGNNIATAATVALDSAAGHGRNILFETAGSYRWDLFANNAAESGGNAGSNLIVQRFDDTGVSLGTPLTIDRASGLLTMNTGAAISGGASTIDGATIGGTTPAVGTFTNLTATGTVSGAGFMSLLSPYALLASPALTGTPTAPTAAANTSTTQLATTAFVMGQVGGTAVYTAQGTGAVARTIAGSLNEKVSVVDFGADPTGVADSTAAFNNACALGAAILVPPGNYKISGQIALAAGATLRGLGQSPATITTTAASFVLFAINGSNVTVENLTIQNGAKTGGADFVLNCPTADVIQTRVQNIVSYSSYGFWTDAGAGNNAYYLTWLTNCVTRVLRGTGFSFTRSCAFLYVENCTADFVGSASANFSGFALSGSALCGRGAVGGAFIRQCAVNGTSGTGSNTSQYGFNFVNFTAIWISLCSADTCDGVGYAFTTVGHVHAVGLEASICNNHGFAFTGCTYFELDGCKTDGRNGMSGATASAHGFCFLNTNSRMCMTGCQAFDMTGDGIFVPQQSGCVNITGGIASTNGGLGIAASGTSAVLVNGLICTGNTGGNYNLSGGSQWLRDTMLHSGTVVSVGPGPISG